MNENRRQILEMLAAGKITADEAERLLAALEPDSSGTTGEFLGSVAGGNGTKSAAPKSRAKYLRVLVEADEGMTGMKGQTTVNVRVPMQLLRAGVRLDRRCRWQRGECDQGTRVLRVESCHSSFCAAASPSAPLAP